MYVLLWIGGEILLAILAVRIFLYAICVLLRVEEVARDSILAGALYGSLVGIVLGPIAIVVLIIVLNSIYGTTFLGLEILAGPIVGAVVCAIPGSIVAAIREMGST